MIGVEPPERQGGRAFRFLLPALFFLFAFGGCRPAPEPDSDRAEILVTVPPLSGLVHAVAGDTCSVVVLVPPGKEPETFMPTPSQMREIARCGVFFRVGLPVEESIVGRLSSLNPRLRVVNLAQRLPVAAESAEEIELTEPNGEDGAHPHHDGIDPHVWMSPSNLEEMAAVVEKTLSGLFPENAPLYHEQTLRFSRDAEALKESTAERLASLRNRTLYVFHPAYGYYCAEFGLRQAAVEAGGKSPKSKDFVELIRRLREENAEKIFVQPQFSRTAVEKVASELNLNIEVHSPLETDPLKNIETLTDALQR